MRNVQVQVIPAKKQKMSSKNFTPTGKRKVAAYARVSTDSEEQLNSYRSQVDYYTNYINSSLLETLSTALQILEN